MMPFSLAQLIFFQLFSLIIFAYAILSYAITLADDISPHFLRFSIFR
jgi:hypothetical protein